MDNVNAYKANLSGAGVRMFRAFVEFRKTKPTAKITIKELCEKANVNRSTFYRNYYDIFDIEEKIENYCVGTIVSFCSALNFGLSDGILEGAQLNISKFSDAFVIDFVLAEGKNERFLKKLFDAVLETVPALIFPDTESEEYHKLSTSLCFILSAALGLCSDLAQSAVLENFYAVAAISLYLFKRAIVCVKNDSWPTVPMAENGGKELRKKKERLNVMKTKRSLKRAFLELLEKKPLEEVSVSELCEKAEICNSTFYTHFNSLDNFLSTLKEDILNNFLNIAYSAFFERGGEPLGVGILISYIKITQKIFIPLSKKNSNIEKIFVLPQNFAERFYPLVEKHCHSEFDGQIAFNFICYGAWRSLFRPFADMGETQMEIMFHAYRIFIALFEFNEEAVEN